MGIAREHPKIIESYKLSELRFFAFSLFFKALKRASPFIGF